MLQLPITYSKVANAVNQCAKSPQFIPLITMLGGAANLTSILFLVFQANLVNISKDKTFWINKLKASVSVVSSMSAKWHELSVAIISKMGG